MEKNEIFTAVIDGYTSEGQGVCRYEGRAVFVPGTLMGEEWRVRIVKVGKGAVYGRGEECLSPSECRVTPSCPAAGRCGGCALLHMDYAEEQRFKLRRVNDALQRIGGTDFAVDTLIPAGEDALQRGSAGRRVLPGAEPRDRLRPRLRAGAPRGAPRRRRRGGVDGAQRSGCLRRGESQ